MCLAVLLDLLGWARRLATAAALSWRELTLHVTLKWRLNGRRRAIGPCKSGPPRANLSCPRISIPAGRCVGPPGVARGRAMRAVPLGWRRHPRLGRGGFPLLLGPRRHGLIRPPDLGPPDLRPSCLGPSCRRPNGLRPCGSRLPRCGGGAVLSCAVGARLHRAHSRRAVAARIRLRPVGGRYAARWTGVRRSVESRLTLLAWPGNGRIGGRSRPGRGRARRLRRRARRNERSRRRRGGRNFRSDRRRCSRTGLIRGARRCPVTAGQSAAGTTQVARLIAGTARITSVGRALRRLLRRPSFA